MTAGPNRPEGVDESDGPRSVLRVLQVLAALAADPDGLTLAELCRHLGLPKTSVHTMIRLLESAGYVSRDDRTYRLGPQAVTLGTAMATGPRQAFPECGMGVLRRVVRSTGETGFFAVLTPDLGSCRYVAAVDSEQWLRFSVEVGSLKPAFATGSGRAMLAFLPQGDLLRALRVASFERITSRTIASRPALRQALQAVRQRGVAAVDGGTVAGVTSVAAPIVDAAGRVGAAMTVGGPSDRMGARRDEIEQRVIEGAIEVSRILGYHGEWPPR